VTGHQITCVNGAACHFIKTLLSVSHMTVSHYFNVFCLILLVSEGQAVGNWKIPNKGTIFLLQDQRVTSPFLVLFDCVFILSLTFMG